MLALAANKLRSGLTMLGIIIGVGAVIALLSIGRGVEKFFVDSLQASVQICSSLFPVSWAEGRPKSEVVT